MLRIAAMRRATRLEVLQRAEADGGIEALGDEIDEAVAVGGLDGEAWMAERQLGQDRRQMRRAEGEGNRQAQAAHHLAALLRHRLARLLEVGQDALGACLVLGAGLGGADAAGGAAQKPGTQLRLEPGQPAADNRLRDAEALGGAAEAAGLDDLDEGPDVIQLGHLFVPLGATIWRAAWPVLRDSATPNRRRATSSRDLPWSVHDLRKRSNVSTTASGCSC